ncbi:MAG: glycoside hydrolase family 2 sugar binding protein [Bryobacterales bacterium]|nr:glycoside hydrolase family 2 sugar binding protein [Bryobacterales bacterium]
MSEQAHEAYPRPQLRRDTWICLDGEWDFAFDAEPPWSHPEAVLWSEKIQVPFSPETPASGIHCNGLFRTVWYRRNFDAPALQPGERLLLHFGAVDYSAEVWVNGLRVCSHEGGYTPFHVDITDTLQDGVQEVIVRAEDDPLDLAKPRGKQDWKLDPHSIWYPRTTGIWQTVWLEPVPTVRIDRLSWTSNLHRWEIGLEALIAGIPSEQLHLYVCMRVGDELLAEDNYSVISNEVHRQIALSDPGVDDSRNELLWSPSSPTIIDVKLELRDRQGQILDSVVSYTALRAISVQGDRFILNGRPLPLRLVLDQGYWPESGLTAPNDDALLGDVILAKKLGFNGVRKHQKIEHPRYLYWADNIGLLVWEEMPSAYRYTRKSVERVTSEWIQILKRDISHPCIVAWVPLNESWGVPDLPDSAAQRNYVQALYHLTKTLDPTRPVIGNDGWESVATDILGIHDYDAKPERIGKRYGQTDVESRLLDRERPGGRMLMIGPKGDGSQPIVLSEFGGIALGANEEENAWGYSRSLTPEELRHSYCKLLEVVRCLPALAGFCYTQFADTYQEANGLLYADRRPKVPFEAIAAATAGPEYRFDPVENSYWRDRLMERQR